MNNEFVKRLSDIVEANLADEKFGVEDLVREMGISHISLHRKLKTISNQTISQVIREIRLKKAKELLLNEDLTVSEISYRVGFGSPTYFNKCFHEYFGYPPGESKNQELISKTIEIPENTILKNTRRTPILIGLIISLIIIISLTILLFQRGSFSKSVNTKEKSIALLPFKSLSNDPEKQYIADGVMDDILLHLSKIKDLRVISRTSVEQYRKTDKTAKTIGNELDVAYLLEGSFLKEGEKSRLILQLIRTSDESHAWVNEYDRQWKDILSVQSEVTETIAGELKAVITPDEKQLIRKVSTTNLTAYDFYQRGKDEYARIEYNHYRTAIMSRYGRNEKNNDKAGFVKAQNLYHKALACDSTFAQAYTGLAWILWDKNFEKTTYFTNFTDSVLILANRALYYDNQLAEAYCIRGCCYMIGGNIEQATKEFDKAIKLNPNDWEAYYQKGTISHGIFEDYTEAFGYYLEASVRNRGKDLPGILSELGNAYLDAGFTDHAKQYYQESYFLDGDSAGYFNSLAFIEACKANFEDALILGKKAYAIDSNYVYSLALYCSFLGRDKELCDYYEKFIELENKSEFIPINYSHRIGYYYSKLGKLKEAEYYFNLQIKYNLENIKFSRYLASAKAVYYDQAAVYAVLGDKAKAFENLDELNKKKSFGLWWIVFLKYDPLFASIRQEPRFQQIIKEVEFKYQAEHERVRKWLEEQKML